MNYIKQKDSNWRNKIFHVHSNDIKWCITNNFLKHHNINIVYKNLNEIDGLKHMVMTRSGGVAANSSYSWMGLWLNRNNSAIKIFPSRWDTKKKNSDIYFKGSIVLDVV